MKKRGITIEEVKEAIADPKHTRLSKFEDNVRYNVLGRNNIIVIYDHATKNIVTVYIHKKEYYQSRNKQRKNRQKKKKRGLSRKERHIRQG